MVWTRVGQLLIFVVRCVAVLAIGFWAVLAAAPSVYAASADPYVARYLDMAKPVDFLYDAQGKTHTFTLNDVSQGKRLFEESCINCHVGGATLPDPTTPLSLDALRGATPARDNISNLVEFIRQPMTYDGQYESVLCRAVSEDWMSASEVENLAAFILRAAQKAPRWGTSDF